MKISRYIASNEISLKYRVYRKKQYRSWVVLNTGLGPDQGHNCPDQDLSVKMVLKSPDFPSGPENMN